MAICNEITYPTVWHANQALRIIVLKGSSLGGKLSASVYPCGGCKGWHRTSTRANGKAAKWQLNTIAPAAPTRPS